MKEKISTHMKRVNGWRDSYNPLRGLTMPRAVALLELGQRGAYADVQWLYFAITRRNAVLQAVQNRRISALKKLDWNIKERASEDASEQALAKQQAEALRAAYDGINNLREAIAFLALASFRGFSHLEKHYNADGDVVHLERVPQWHWVRQGINGDWQYNAAASSGTLSGVKIEPQHFLMREVEYPICEIAVLAHLRQNLSQKDWDAFIETYGVPALFVEMPPNIPQDREKDYQALAEEVISDARGTLPNGAKIQTVDPGIKGTSPFREHLRYQDEQVVLAGTGGKLTMLTESGSGTLAGSVHDRVFNEIAQAEAMEISETFQRQFDSLILAEKFPGQPTLAYFELAAAEETDPADIIDHAVKLAQAGYQMDPAELSEKTGYKLVLKPAAPAALPAASPASLANRSSGPVSADNATAQVIAKARVQLAQAIGQDLQPVRNALEKVLQMPDKDFAAALNRFRDELPALLRKINAKPEAAAVLEKALSAAAINGLTEVRQ